VEEQLMAERNLIIKWRVGSHLYGTNTLDSDEDTVGICVPDIDYVIGTKRFEQHEHRTNSAGTGKRNTSQDSDLVIYSLPKFLHLLTGNNPNIVELLFATENCVLFKNEYGQAILDHAKLFVSKKAYHTFSGYAHQQRHKLSTKQPEGSRKELVDQYGYDTKFGYHLIRLYYESIELLADGRITFPLSCRKQLLNIKRGETSLAEVLAEADRLKALTDTVWANSPLQQSADVVAINRLQKKLLMEFWKATGQI